MASDFLARVTFRASRAVRNTEPGHIDIEPCPDEEWPLYWVAYVGGERVNGGLGLDTGDCIARGHRAIEVWRTQWFLRHNDWDHVSHEWFERDEPLLLYSPVKGCNR